MSERIDGTRVAVIATDGVERSELTDPVSVIADAGGTALVISPGQDSIRSVEGLEPGEDLGVDLSIDDANPEDYDALVLPGGHISPDTLRQDERVLEFVRQIFRAGKPVGVICHGPWTLIDAGVVSGRTLTSYPSLRTDLENAGAIWVDEEVHVDAGLVSSRRPSDLPAFCAKVVEEVAEGRHRAQSRSAPS